MVKRVCRLKINRTQFVRIAFFFLAEFNPQIKQCFRMASGSDTAENSVKIVSLVGKEVSIGRCGAR